MLQKRAQFLWQKFKLTGTKFFVYCTVIFIVRTQIKDLSGSPTDTPDLPLTMPKKAAKVMKKDKDVLSLVRVIGEGFHSLN